MKMPNGEKNGNYIHGGKNTKLYEVWCSMRQRCNNPNSKMYKHYGERGIKVCEEWQKDYSSFKKWAISNGYCEGLTIDRIDNNGDYSPSNCRWATWKMQANNQRKTTRIEYLGVCRTLHEWSDFLGIAPNTLYHRLYKLGWSTERAFTEKVSLNKYFRQTVNITEKIKSLE